MQVLVGANIPDAIASLVSDETVSDTIHADVKDVLDNQGESGLFHTNF